jgi:AcrR family transcriptional regulator
VSPAPSTTGPATDADLAAEGRSSRRASALPPEARRQAIVEAVIPLLIEHGAAVTTRQIAEAAGIAEGTIFRVFPDKEALVAAAIEKALDPAPLEEQLGAIDRALPLDARLVQAVRVLQDRIANVWRLISSTGFTRPPAASEEAARQRNLADVPSLAALFEPDAANLRGDSATNARRLRALAIAGSHPALAGDHTMSPEEIVSIFLDGTRVHSATPTAEGAR